MKNLKNVIKGCLKNDRKSQFLLYDHCFNQMMSICLRYEHDEDLAMEILNNAFLKVLTGLKDYNSKFPLLPWVKRITVNEAIDQYRKKRRRLMVVSDKELASVKEPGGYASENDWIESEYLEHLLESLKEDEKTIFNLYAIDGYAHKEIAELLGISERTSIRHLASARQKLQEKVLERVSMKKA